MKKRLIALIVAVALILGALTTFLVVRAVRAKRAPSLEALRPRIEALISASYEVNELLWGKGLPTYPRIYRPSYPGGNFYMVKTGDVWVLTEDDTQYKRSYYIINDKEVGMVVAYQYYVADHSGGNTVYIDIENNTEISSVGKYRYALKVDAPKSGETPIFEKDGAYYYALPDYKEFSAEYYYTNTDDEHYDYVVKESPYHAVDDIKNHAEQVYARVYLASVYTMLFDGAVVEGSGSLMHARYMEYTDDEGNIKLKQSNLVKPMNVGRVFLFDTMRMSKEKKSNATNVFVEMETHPVGDPTNVLTVTVALVLQDGLWYLNSPTY